MKNVKFNASIVEVTDSEIYAIVRIEHEFFDSDHYFNVDIDRSNESITAIYSDNEALETDTEELFCTEEFKKAFTKAFSNSKKLENEEFSFNSNIALED